MPAAANPMRDQVLATPDALQASFTSLERAARLVLSTPEIHRTRRVVVTGSGDSYFAAKAAEMALLSHGAIPVEIRPPMEAGRYHAELSNSRDVENTLLIAISNSGRAVRVREATSLYQARGALVLAISSDARSPLAEVAGRLLELPAPQLPPGPGFGTYALAFLALSLFAIRLGEVRMAMTMDEARGLLQELESEIDTLRRIIADLDQPCRALATKLGDVRLFEFVGAGPEFAVSGYGAAKMLEAVGRHALSCDLEEWTHLNYFDASPDEIATILTIPKNSRAQGRAVELLAYMNKLDRKVIVVGGGPAADAASAAGQTILAVEREIDEIRSPLLLSAPLALIAASLAELQGAEYGRGGRGPWANSSDASTVQKSAIWDGRR